MRTIHGNPTGPSITPDEALARTDPKPEGPQFRQGKERSYMDLLGDMLYAASSPLAGLKAAGFGLDGPMHIPTRYEVDKERYGMDYVLGLTPAAGAAYLASMGLGEEDTAALALAATPARNVAPFTRIVDEPIWQKITKRANELLADYQANPQSAPLQLKKDIGGTLSLEARPVRMIKNAEGAINNSSAPVDVVLTRPGEAPIITGSMGFSSFGKAGAVMDDGRAVPVMTRGGDFPFERLNREQYDMPEVKEQLIGSGASSLMTQALNQAMKEQGLRLASSDAHSTLGLERYLKLKDRGVVKQISDDVVDVDALRGMSPEAAAAELGIPTPTLDDLEINYAEFDASSADWNTIDEFTTRYFQDMIDAKMYGGAFTTEPRFLFYRNGGKFRILKR